MLQLILVMRLQADLSHIRFVLNDYTNKIFDFKIGTLVQVDTSVIKNAHFPAFMQNNDHHSHNTMRLNYPLCKQFLLASELSQVTGM